MPDWLAFAVIAGLLLCLVALLVHLWEIRAVFALREWTFRIGPLVYQSSRSHKVLPAGPADRRGSTRHAQFKVGASGSWLFSGRPEFFNSWLTVSRRQGALYTPYCIKGIARWHAGTVTVIGRFPVAALVWILVSFLTFVTVGVVALLDEPLFGACFLGIFLTIWGFMVGAAVVEVRRFPRVADEFLQELLSGELQRAVQQDVAADRARS